MKIAILGAGISGLVCGYLLRRNHEITIFEANSYIGGHTHTHPILAAVLAATDGGRGGWRAGGRRRDGR